MALIGFIALISLIGLYIGLIGVIVTSTMTIWLKLTLISLTTFMYVGTIAAGKEKKSES